MSCSFGSQFDMTKNLPRCLLLAKLSLWNLAWRNLARGSLTWQNLTWQNLTWGNATWPCPTRRPHSGRQRLPNLPPHLCPLEAAWRRHKRQSKNSLQRRLRGTHKPICVSRLFSSSDEYRHSERSSRTVYHIGAAHCGLTRSKMTCSP
jgi:hypothetical protein